MTKTLRNKIQTSLNNHHDTYVVEKGEHTYSLSYGINGCMFYHEITEKEYTDILSEFECERYNQNTINIIK